MIRYKEMGIICLAACLVYVRTAFAQIDPASMNEEQRRQHLEMYRKEFRKLFAGHGGHVVIEGDIVDEEGSPLKDVQVIKDGAIVEIKEPIRFDQLSRNFREKEMVSDHVRLEYNDLSSLELSFNKAGYHSVKKNYIFLKPNVDVEIKEDTHYYKNQVFVLRKYKNVTQLKEYNVIFSGSLENDLDVWNLQEQPMDSTQYIKLKKEANAENIHYPALYINVTKAKQPEEDVVVGVNKFPAKRKVGLVIHDETGGGFIVSQPGDGITLMDMLKTMMEAPDVKYSPELILPQRLFLGETKYLFFYFKLNGCYGKGYLSAAYTEKTGFMVSVNLHIQPDGTRNLETQ